MKMKTFAPDAVIVHYRLTNLIVCKCYSLLPLCPGISSAGAVGGLRDGHVTCDPNAPEPFARALLALSLTAATAALRMQEIRGQPQHGQASSEREYGFCMQVLYELYRHTSRGKCASQKGTSRNASKCLRVLKVFGYGMRRNMIQN